MQRSHVENTTVYVLCCNIATKLILPVKCLSTYLGIPCRRGDQLLRSSSDVCNLTAQVIVL